MPYNSKQWVVPTQQRAVILEQKGSKFISSSIVIHGKVPQPMPNALFSNFWKGSTS
ncbi:hypothetical protein NUACC26_048680 [Scytonema sp. NUACC26]